MPKTSTLRGYPWQSCAWIAVRAGWKGSRARGAPSSRMKDWSEDLGRVNALCIARCRPSLRVKSYRNSPVIKVTKAARLSLLPGRLPRVHVQVVCDGRSLGLVRAR